MFNHGHPVWRQQHRHQCRRSVLAWRELGLGIPLGDRCTIESGLYLTAGSKVRVLDESGATIKEVKARDLAGVSDLLFRRNSMTGTIECLANARAIELNPALHSHN